MKASSTLPNGAIGMIAAVAAVAVLITLIDGGLSHWVWLTGGVMTALYFQKRR